MAKDVMFTKFKDNVRADIKNINQPRARADRENYLS